MKIMGDYHTHTIFTHGTGTIEENVKSAIDRGLKEIAITEHSFKHMAHGINKKKFYAIKAEVERLRKIYDIKILLGIEADLISDKGDIDVDSEILPQLDIIVLGYHKLFFTNILQFFKFLVPNTFRPWRASKRRIEKNTQAYMRAIERYPINILAHLKYANCDVDVEKLSKFACEHNVFVELNGKGMYFTDEELENLKKNNIKLILDSDAHESESVGTNQRAFCAIFKHDFDENNLVNVDKLPDFKRS